MVVYSLIITSFKTRSILSPRHSSFDFTTYEKARPKNRVQAQMKKPDEKTGTDICFFLMSGAGLIDFFCIETLGGCPAAA